MLWLAACLATVLQQHSHVSAASSSEVGMGTTILALRFKDGVIVAADTRTSVSGYVSNRFARKINILLEEPASSCVVCRSGSAADTQWLAREAKYEFASRKLRFGILPSVSQIAHYLKYKIRSADSGLSASLICAGYDAETGSHIYAITPGGSLLEEDMFCVSGSGSTYILGHLDYELRDRPLLEEQDAIDTVVRMVRLSIARDSSSGGLIRIVVMNANGLREITVYPEAPDNTTAATKNGRDLEGFAKVRPVQASSSSSSMASS